MHRSNRGLLKDFSLRKSFSSYLACCLKTLGGNPKIICNKKIRTYGKHVRMVKKVWVAFKLTVEGYSIFDKQVCEDQSNQKRC